MKCVRVDDALVKNNFISLRFFNHFQGFGVGVLFDLVGIMYRDDSWFFEGCSYFIDNVGFQKVKVQLGLSAHVEGEFMYSAFHFSISGSVAVILGTSGSKLNDVVPGFQFTEIITHGWQINSIWLPIKVKEIVTSLATSWWVRQANGGWMAWVDYTPYMG